LPLPLCPQILLSGPRACSATASHFAGARLTLADINLLALFDPCEIANIDISSYKNIVRWRETLRKEKFYTDCHQEYGAALKVRLAALKAGSKS